MELSCWNVRGCNQPIKRQEILDTFRQRRYDFFVLSETKLKVKKSAGRGRKQVTKEWWEDVAVVRTGVDENEHAKGGVAILMTKEMENNLKGHGCVGSRIVWVSLEIDGERLVIFGVYAPTGDGWTRERESFWCELNKEIEMVGERDKVVVLGDMNARIGNNVVEGVTGKFGVRDKVNVNGSWMIQVCAERQMVVGNTLFEKKLIHKYTWTSGIDGSRALLDYVLVDRRMKGELLDVNVRRGLRGEVSDHEVVEARVRIIRKKEWRRKKSKKRVIKVRELDKREVAERYEKKIEGNWKEMERMEEGSIEEEWENFRGRVLKSAEEVCGTRVLGVRARRNEWWDEEVKILVEEKKELYEKQRNGGEEDKRRYKEKSKEVKRMVKTKKKEADERLGKKLSESFKENKKKFWCEVNRARKAKEEMGMEVRNKEGKLIGQKEEIKEIWIEHFSKLLNPQIEQEAELTTLGVEGMGEGSDLGERKIWRKEVERAVKMLKSGKAPGVDGITGEMLKRGGKSMIDWLQMLFEKCRREGRVPEDWKKSCVVPIYKGKGDRRECKNYRGISLLSVVGKVYGRILVERIRETTERKVGEEQGGFRRGKGCVDQVFALKQINEKYTESGKELYLAFMDLEKAYDSVDRAALWRVMEMYGVGGKLIKAVESMYEGGKACVRVCGEETPWFDVETGLRQGCVMSPWLFNIYMDGLMRELKVKTKLSGVVLGEGGERWRINHIMFADDVVLMGDSDKELQEMVSKFEEMCRRRKLRVNVNKSKVMRMGKRRSSPLEIKLEGGSLEEVEVFRYLGVDLAADGGMEKELEHRLTEARKAMGALKKVWGGRKISIQAKVGMVESIVDPMLLYGSELWTLGVVSWRKVEALEMDCLRGVCGLRRLDKIPNKDIVEKCKKEVRVGEKMSRALLRWYGHVERMEEDRLIKRVYEAKAEGKRDRGRPKKRWRESVKERVERKGLNMEEVKLLVENRREWRRWYKGDKGGERGEKKTNRSEGM